MPTRPDCPDASALEQWLVGQLSGPAADRLERHLDTCPRCADTLRSLSAEDDLSRALRPPLAPAETPLRELAEAAIPALKRLRPKDATATWGGVTTEVEGPAAARAALPDIGERVGGYALLGPLGAGGMGVVFRAEDPVLKRRVAIKLIQPALAAAAGARGRFLREAQALAALDHDHIVTVFQAGEDRGVLFLAMQLLRGQTLQQMLDEGGGPLPTDEVLRIGREIASGLAAAHARGLVHRDIKPGNVWLEDASERVKILDFGLVEALAEPGAGEAGKVLGTPAYMAPEQAAGKPVDGRADLFALGCVLYRMATGKPPFAAPDLVGLLLKVTTEEPPPPRELIRDIPAPLDRLITHLLCKNPADRPESAAAVADEIVRIEDQLRSKVSRRKWLVGTAAAVLLAGGAGVLVARKFRDPPPPPEPPGEVTFEYDEPDARISLESGGQPAGVFDLRRDGPTLTLGPGAYAVRAVTAGEGQFVWPRTFTVVGGEKGTVVLRLVGLVGGHKQHSPLPVGGAVLREPPDGLTVISVGHDRTLVGWSPASKDRPLQVLDRAGPFRCCALSPDGKALAVGLGDVTPKAVQAVRFRDPVTLEPAKGEFRARDRGMISALAYSPDGKFLFVGEGDGWLSRWEIKPAVAEEERRCDSAIHAIALAPDGRHVFTAGGGGAVAEWAATDLKPVRAFAGPAGTVHGLAVFPNGNQLAAAGEDKTIRVWDRATGKVAASWAAPEVVHSLAASPDGTRLATGDAAGGVRVWDAGTREEVVHFAGHSGAVTVVTFTPDGRRVVSGGTDGAVRLWSLPK